MADAIGKKIGAKWKFYFSYIIITCMILTILCNFFYWFLDIEIFYKCIKSILYFIKSIVFKIFLNKLQIIVGGFILIFSNYYMRYFFDVSLIGRKSVRKRMWNKIKSVQLLKLCFFCVSAFTRCLDRIIGDLCW